MQNGKQGPGLSAVFVDYDNIYLSLKRKDDEIAKQFARDAALWSREIENGRLITPTSGHVSTAPRRIVMNRCYGNPVPRRNSRDNSTDMSSFPFVRHHFLRAGFEVVDCPPLTAQLKNSSDIRMVMDIRDYLTHDTYFDEFVILSGDADFTPLLHRLRAHARRTIVYVNEATAAPYTAICDGEIREADLIALLAGTTATQRPAAPVAASDVDNEETRRLILAEIIDVVNKSDRPVPIETLADKALRSLGHDKTIQTEWAGHGSFRSFLTANLPEDIRLSEASPYLVFDVNRQRGPTATPVVIEPARPTAAPAPVVAAAAAPVVAQPAELTPPKRTPLVQQPPSVLHQSITRIHDACQAPPLAPPDYRMLFEAMAAELTENGLSGAQTVTNIMVRAHDLGLEVKRDDVRFVLDVVSEADPWFELGASASLFAGRFRNYVVARCRGFGLSLSSDELDLIDAWFAGGGSPPAGSRGRAQSGFAPAGAPRPQSPPVTDERPPQVRGGRPEAGSLQAVAGQADDDADYPQLPRFVRARNAG